MKKTTMNTFQEHTYTKINRTVEKARQERKKEREREFKEIMAQGWNNERILIMISWMKLMNRNDVGKNFINVNLFIKTKWSEQHWKWMMVAGKKGRAVRIKTNRRQLCTKTLIWCDDKNQKHQCIYLSIDGHNIALLELCCYQTAHISKSPRKTPTKESKLRPYSVKCCFCSLSIKSENIPCCFLYIFFFHTFWLV